MIRRIFGNKRQEVTRGCRKLHSEKLHNLHSSPNIRAIKSRKMIMWVGHAACVGKMGTTYRKLVRKHKENMTLARCRHRLELIKKIGS
jgi:hypothetical protein